MNKETQDIAWASLQKEVRKEIRAEYQNAIEGSDLESFLQDFFGLHNLTSDTEPEEMLMVPRAEVQEAYQERACASSAYNKWDEDCMRYESEMTLLQSLFGDKCLPDKEESKPKFKVGDLALVKDGYAKGSVITIKAINIESPISYKSDITDDGMAQWFLESMLEPYTEESRNLSQETANCDKSEDNQLKDNMEEKELNLCELLKGCEREKIFLPDEGECEIVSVKEDKIELSQESNRYIILCDDSLWIKHTGFAYAYPSKESFLANPLNAPKTWKEWKEARVNKRWHPKDGEKFWHLNEFMNVVSSFYDKDSFDDYTMVNETDNCFQSYELCQQAAEAVRECLTKFHEQNQKQ